MKYYIGIDGGGTKTMFAILNEDGEVLGTHLLGTADYKQIGADGVIALLRTGIEAVCEQTSVEKTQIAGCCFGMPCFGESPVNDNQILSFIKKELSQYHIHVVNDVEVGWAASLLLEPGINLVAGTGSIAFGKNEEGKTARSGGWSEWFSDEGSGRWLAMKCMELFSKEADGRLEKGPLYHLVRKHFAIEQDEEVIDIFEKEYLPKRSKFASLQKVLLEAAKKQDKAAMGAYQQAVEELYLIVLGVKRQLFLEQGCKVSYSGGIFNIEDLVKEPFCEKLELAGIEVCKPQTQPHIGAALLAYEEVHGKKPDWKF